SSSQTVNVTWDNSFSPTQFSNLTAGQNIMRIRLSTSRVLRCDSEHYSDNGDYADNYFISPDGEVEDYEIEVQNKVTINPQDCTNAPQDIIDFSEEFDFNKSDSVLGNGSVGTVATYEDVANINGKNVDLKVKVLALTGLSTLALPPEKSTSVPKGFKFQKIGDANSVGFFIDQIREDTQGTEYSTELEFSFIEHGTDTPIDFSFETQVFDLDNFANRTEYVHIKENDYKFFQTDNPTHIVATQEGEWSTFSNGEIEDSQNFNKNASVKFVHEQKNKFVMKFTHVKNKNSGNYGGKAGFNVVFGKPSNGLPTCQVETAEPIAEYRFDECTWNGTAGEVKDSSSNNFHGTSSSAKTNNIAQINRSGLFNGTNAYITQNNLYDSLKTTSSLSFWIKTTQSGDNTMWRAPGIVGIEEAGGGDDIFWGWIDASGHIGLLKGNTAGAKSTTTINDNNWHHVVLTRNSSTGQCQVFINGNLENSKVSETGDVGNRFNKIGVIEDTGGTPSYFNGQLDELKVFDTELNESEIQNIYNNEKTHKNWDGTIRNAIVCTPPPTLYISNEETYEGNSSTHNLDFTVALDKVPNGSVSFNYQVLDGNGSVVNNATAPSDYTATSGSATLSGNTQTYTISVPILGDEVVEDDEQFRVVLSNIQGAIIGNSSAIGTILNDDSAISWGTPTDLDEDNDGILDDVEFGDYPNLVQNPSFEIDDCMDATRFPNGFTG
ncbi:MAG TPA: hypothetical protein ENK91_07905, partial [Bacteroidetes bacterium]|nr:hypothetical protein [Bacteroidota bacterium]